MRRSPGCFPVNILRPCETFVSWISCLLCVSVCFVEVVWVIITLHNYRLSLEGVECIWRNKNKEINQIRRCVHTFHRYWRYTEQISTYCTRRFSPELFLRGQEMRLTKSSLTNALVLESCWNGWKRNPIQGKGIKQMDYSVIQIIMKHFDSFLAKNKLLGKKTHQKTRKTKFSTVSIWTQLFEQIQVQQCKQEAIM